MTAQRIQLRRTKGWRKPEGAVVVSRPSKWGNPFRVVHADGRWLVAKGPEVWTPPENTKASATNHAVRVYRGSLFGFWNADARREIAEELRGHNLACWCPLDQPCHADVLLEVANR